MALAAHASTARADARSEERDTTQPSPPQVRGMPRGTIVLDAGPRMSIVPDAALGPYSTGSIVPQLALGVGLVPIARGPASLAVRAGWDVGGTSATARSDQTSLTLHRLSLGLEGRYAANPWFHVFARVAPGAMHLRASIEDMGLDVPLVSRSWTWTLDTTGGAALRLGAAGKPESPVRFWMVAEGGYGFAGKSEMTFTPDVDADDPRHFGETTMAPLRLAGAMTRVSFAVTF